MSDRSGGVAVNFALALPFLMLLAGGVVDYSLALGDKAVAQSTADAASLAGAKALSMADTDKANVESIVAAVVSAHKEAGVARTAKHQYDVTTHTISEDGAPLQVEVTLKTKTKPGFGATLGLRPLNLEVRSVAVVIGRPNVCLLALNPSAMGTLYLQKNAKIIGQDCGVYSNSTHPNGIKAFNSSMLKADLICSAGGKAGGKGNFDPDPITDCPQFDDPLAGRPEPAVDACTATNLIIDSVMTTLNPGTYCGGITVQGSASVKLDPGVFVIKDGPLIVKGTAAFEGDDVGVYLTGAKSRFSFDTGTTVNLTAPKAGAMAGMLFFGSRSQSGLKHEIKSDNARQLLGTIYLPTGELSIDANQPIADKSAYTAIVADKVTGNSGPTVTLNTNYDLTDVPVPDGIRGTGQPVALAQ
ncbi:MAG: TadE/TadG family type IV pilus assembly protein [Hyphomicrobium sp.]